MCLPIIYKNTTEKEIVALMNWESRECLEDLRLIPYGVSIGEVMILLCEMDLW